MSIWSRYQQNTYLFYFILFITLYHWTDWYTSERQGLTGASTSRTVPPNTILDAVGNQSARGKLRGQVWIDNQIHVRPWPDRESNPGCSGERRGNICCANPSPHFKYIVNKCVQQGQLLSKSVTMMAFNSYSMTSKIQKMLEHS